MRPQLLLSIICVGKFSSNIWRKSMQISLLREVSIQSLGEFSQMLFLREPYISKKTKICLSCERISIILCSLLDESVLWEIWLLVSNLQQVTFTHWHRPLAILGVSATQNSKKKLLQSVKALKYWKNLYVEWGFWN